MAYTYDLSGLTLNAEEAQMVSEAVFEYVLKQSKLSEYHEIHENIQWKKQIVFIGTLGLVGKKIIACSPDANGNQIPISEKFWEPELIGDKLEHCAIEGDALFKLFGKAKKVNPDLFDRIGSEDLQIVMARVAEAMQEMLNRIVWFGDTAADEVSEDGYLTDGTDIDFFNILDGLWVQIFTDIPDTSPYYVEIAANSEATYADQADLDADMAYSLFKAMWKASDSRFKQLVTDGNIKPVIHVTPDIYENWTDYKEDKSVGFTLQNIEDGGLKSLFRNMVIVPRYDWDAIIKTYQDNETTYNLPNRALMTVKENIPVGTVSEKDLEEIKSFYVEDREVNVMKFALKLDAKFLEDYLAVAAY